MNTLLELNLYPFNIPILSQSLGESTCYLENPSDLPIFNPSVVQFNKKYIFISRCSNILNYEDGNYFYESKPHKTINLLHFYDANFKLINTATLKDDLLKRKFQSVKYGIEDIRLFIWEGRLWGIGAGIGDGPTGRSITQILFEIDGNEVISGFQLHSPHNRVYEKNWVPLINREVLLFIYQLNPLEIYRYQNGKIIGEVIPKFSDSNFDIKGSTPFISLNNHWLGLVHSGPIKHMGGLHYTHRFCLLDSKLRRMDLSMPFFLQRRGIEFACGLIADGSSLLISYGVSDRASAFMKMPIEKLKNWIVSPPLLA
jgi:hypothetical protein